MYLYGKIIMDKIKELYYKTFFIINFDIQNEKTIKAFICFLETLSKNYEFDIVLQKYSNFIKSLEDMDFSKILKENLSYIRKSENIENELKIISELTEINYELIKQVLLENYPQYKSVIEILPYFKNN